MSQIELDKSNNNKYKIEVIHDSEVYARQSDNSHLSGFYYLVS